MTLIVNMTLKSLSDDNGKKAPLMTMILRSTSDDNDIKKHLRQRRVGRNTLRKSFKLLRDLKQLRQPAIRSSCYNNTNLLLGTFLSYWLYTILIPWVR